jgi:mannose-6-phosphate isomerase-like protein (cupin superfamily)
MGAGGRQQTRGEQDASSGSVIVWGPEEGDRLWVFPESKEELGPGGEFHIYLDPITYPSAAASFARFSLGVGGNLSEHRHERSEEIGYLISGEGVIKRRVDGDLKEVSLRAGNVWYIPPSAWHAVRNTGTEPLVMVFMTIPNHEKGLLSFFRKIGTAPGEEPTVIPREEIARIGSEHDFVLRPHG